MTATKKIETLTVVLAVLTVGFWAYWFIDVLSKAITWAWTDEVLRWRMTETHLVLTFPVRLIYFSMWLVVISAGCTAFYFALRLLGHLWRGAYFTPETCRTIKILGLCIIGVMLCDTLFDTFDHVVLTWNNSGQDLETANGVLRGKPFLGPKYHYDSGDISLGLCGFGFFIIGWVFEVALQTERENREFV